jgi:hypothetical protein
VLDLLAGDRLFTLWWIIADWNDIPFPLDLPASGTTLRIPSYGRVMLEMLD